MSQAGRAILLGHAPSIFQLELFAPCQLHQPEAAITPSDNIGSQIDRWFPQSVNVFPAQLTSLLHPQIQNAGIPVRGFDLPQRIAPSLNQTA